MTPHDSERRLEQELNEALDRLNEEIDEVEIFLESLGFGEVSEVELLDGWLGFRKVSGTWRLTFQTERMPGFCLLRSAPKHVRLAAVEALPALREALARTAKERVAETHETIEALRRFREES
jgi:hypothetical protein